MGHVPLRKKARRLSGELIDWISFGLRKWHTYELTDCNADEWETCLQLELADRQIQYNIYICVLLENIYECFVLENIFT